MLREMVEVLSEGEPNGNNMMIRIKLPSGLEVFGLPTKNFYGGEWDLGPTWNYAVLADRPFLVDTGSHGMGRRLLEMMESVGVSESDLESIVLSHGHEDHDGGLFEIVEATGATVKAHAVYDRLIRIYQKEAPPGVNKDFPASCWRCFMPESFSNQHCRGYHQERNRLQIESIGNGRGMLGEEIEVYHVPGHSPDALAILIGGEALIVGDTVLPDITPIPTREAFFDKVRTVLEPRLTGARSLYGLRTYIRSLKKLEEIGSQLSNLVVLPAHRFFYGNHWNEIDLQVRIAELIQHHIDRCADILRILISGPKTAKGIAKEHFDESLLEGMGAVMAENEILSHCELLCAAGDMGAVEDGRFESGGGSGFESLIKSLDAW